ncbi:MAG: M3 family metallopeptidase [Cyclobacteriaceae bacterium]
MSKELNPLLVPFATPFSTPPFDQIKPDHFMPAIEETISRSKETIEAIADNKETPDFENTIEALEFSGDKLSVINSVLFNLNSAETSDELQKIVKEASPLFSEYNNQLFQNENLFARVKAVYEQKGNLDLNEEQSILLEDTYKSFVRNGANLDKDGKKRYSEISTQTAKLKLQFGENVLAETNDYELVIYHEDDLKGLPEFAISQAAQTATDSGKEGKWVFTLQAPSYIPFMENADNRELREKLFRAFSGRANRGNENDNNEIIRELVSLKAEKASLLGYKNYAAYVLEERMAGNPKKVYDFLDDLLDKAKPIAEKEVEEIRNFAKELDGIEDLQRWDWMYYSDKLKKKKFDIDDELLRPYFKLENVLEGVFLTVNKLYGLSFTINPDIPLYHEEVKAYEVKDKDGSHVAIFYADFHPRKGKRGGAWMTSYRSQKIVNGENIRPHISIVCNFTPSSKDKPSLLTFSEVTTLFHEFGHALHGMLANTVYPGLSGTNVFWDFVELPSQIFENWCYEKECLDLFARHYETDELIPQEYIDKIKASSTFQEAYKTVRQLSFGYLDMGWYSLSSDEVAEKINDPALFEEEKMKSTDLFPKVSGSMMSTQFSHIFAGGYSAGYYSYKWAEVLDADAFSLFLEKGIFNEEVAESFKQTVLSKGGSVHPMTLYKSFRGREPEVDALLKRAGLVK